MAVYKEAKKTATPKAKLPKTKESKDKAKESVGHVDCFENAVEPQVSTEYPSPQYWIFWD